jgi:chemotaxis protein CheY-P-specific phosphatase CheC
MSSTNLPATLATDREALDRALAIVAEESFFAMVEPVPSGVPAVEGAVVSACVTFEGSFSGSLTCRMPRALAHELTAAFTGEEVSSDGEAVDDLAGEFANMVCGRWLTDVAPQSLFRLDHPVVVPVSAPSRAPSGLLNGQPIWVELKVEG